MQKVQRWSQPFCTCTKARVCPSILSIARGVIVRAAMMSPTATRAPPAAQARASSFSVLPSTRSISGMAAKVAGSVCAAQPVTTMRASGRSRLMRRTVCRAWRTASPVTAQVLSTTVSLCASPAAARISSDSTTLSRQPRVRISRGMNSLLSRARRSTQRSGVLRCRPGTRLYFRRSQSGSRISSAPLRAPRLRCTASGTRGGHGVDAFSNNFASNRPANSNSTGPVIST